MALGSFARGALAELTADDLERMLELNETLFVEHKRGIGEEKAFKLAEAVGAFANTLGGWLLLGVQDGTPVADPPAWAEPEAPPLVDYVRDRLRTQLDPMPAFEAKIMAVAAGSVGVVRVYESADAPHVYLDTGSIFVREVAGASDTAKKRRRGGGSRDGWVYEATEIRSREQLLALAQRGESATARVADLMAPTRRLPLVERLGLRFERTAEDVLQPLSTDPGGSVFIRLAPYTVTPRFRGWSTTAEAQAAVLSAAESLSGVAGLDNSWAKPHPAGISITVPLQPDFLVQGSPVKASAHVVVDGVGLVGAGLRLAGVEERRRDWLRLDQLRDDLVTPAIEAAASILRAGEFLGRARCQADFVAVNKSVLVEGTDKVGYWVPTSADLTVPLDESEVAACAQLAVNALGRSGDLPTYDPLPDAH